MDLIVSANGTVNVTVGILYVVGTQLYNYLICAQAAPQIHFEEFTAL